MRDRVAEGSDCLKIILEDGSADGHAFIDRPASRDRERAAQRARGFVVATLSVTAGVAGFDGTR